MTRTRSRFDLVVAGGRVVDPETGLDRVADVGVSGGSIAAVSAEPLAGEVRLDAAGLVVAPGFVDLHSHAQTVPSLRMQALDGVTTALELEAGGYPVAAAYRAAAEEGRPINYGFAASWIGARMAVLDQAPLDGSFASITDAIGAAGWRRLVDGPTAARIVAAVDTELAEGGVGVGLMPGYAPESNREEYLAVAALAARRQVPTYTHVRHGHAREPGSCVEGVGELVHAAAMTGAHMHLCHVNSTGWRRAPELLELLGRAGGFGLRLSTEMYPWGAASTVMGAPWFDPDRLEHTGIGPQDMFDASRGRRVRDLEDLAAIRRETPGDIGVFFYLDESAEADVAVLDAVLAHPDVAVATDALPYLSGGRPVQGQAWPPPDDALAHPRLAGTFCRVLRWQVRERRVLTLAEAIRRMTLVPARIVEAAAPDARRKGRLQPGCDADVVAFDPDTVAERATYDDPRRPSEGMRHVVVGGTPVVRDGRLDPTVLPGRPLRGPGR
jgi:cytosine/adenosine deaminase-related metal-dependent hydrolase